MTIAIATPESILARFAAAYAEHNECCEGMITLRYSSSCQSADTGFIAYDVFNGGRAWWMIPPGGSYCDRQRITPEFITRIDYSNASYRGSEPLWQRAEG